MKRRYIRAAERLVATLADLGVTVTSVTDTATEPTAKEIVVGYTNCNDELADDFYDVGPAGYHIAAKDERLFIGANTEAGMTAAMDRLAADLISDGNRLGIKEYVNGAWVAYKTASKNGYDGYMVHYDGDGTYSFSFIVDMSNCARTF